MTDSLPHRYQQLDGIRGIAILLVLIWHYVTSKLDPQASPLVNFATALLGMTWSGVDLFFVLSGFLIGGILLDNQAAPYYFKAFYIRRICRIFPLYFAWFLLFVAINLGATAFVSSGPLRFIFQYPLPLWSYATFTQNFIMALANTLGPDWLGITWSLAIEEQFYLILPPLIRFTPAQKLPFVLVTMIVAAPILRMILIYIPPHSTFPNYVLMPCRADTLLLGVLSAYLIRQENVVQYLRDHIKNLYVALGVLLAGAILLTFFAPSFQELAVSSYGYTWLALLYSCFILIAMTEKEGIVSQLTKTPWLCKLGLLAYGVYMFHQAINGLAHALVLSQFPQLQTMDDAFVTTGALVVTILIAYCSWNMFEKRIVAIGHTVNYKDTLV